jgi:general secretion pathway protein K
MATRIRETRVRETRVRERGSALLTVLWLCAALSAIGIAVANNVRSETERAATNVDDAKAYFLAKGAIERAALRFFWGRDFYRPGYPTMDLDFPGGFARVEFIPESSKINLNSAPPETLTRLLVALGVGEERAAPIVGAIVDWRTPDPLHQSPFDAFYLAQSPSFAPRHASFQENEELLLVRGVTQDLYYGAALDRTHAGLRDCVSVYGSGGSVDINTAQPATLQAIGLSAADTAALVRLRAQSPIVDPPQLASIVATLGPVGTKLRIGGQTMFTLRATAQLRRPDGKFSDLRRSVAALVKFNLPGNLQRKPVGAEILRWYDRT